MTIKDGIINHPWGQSRDWTSEVKDYSPSHWLAGPPRTPYGFSGEPPVEPQMPLESEQGLPYGSSHVPVDTSLYDDVYPVPATTYIPKSYSQYLNNSSGIQNQPQTQFMNYTGQTNQDQNNNIQQQQDNTQPKEEKTDWYKILYTGSIILMGLGSIAVAAIQYKAYSDKRRKQPGYHHDAESESRS